MNTLEEVLNKLSEIIETSINNNDPIGIFTYVYWRTTVEIKKAITEGQFEDNNRMEAFDVKFATLFIDAYTNYNNQEPISDSWKIAMESGKTNTVIQNVLLGMNAHINLDLSITADHIMAGQSINDLKNDYEKVNDILESLINEMEEKISNTSTLFFLFDWMGGKSDEAIMDFSVRKAREFAWVNAVALSISSESEKKQN
jgi:hypothetical protein